MIRVRRRTPHLQLVRALGLTLSIAAFVLIGSAMIAKSHGVPLSLTDFLRVLLIGVDLLFLALVCSVAGSIYGMRSRNSDHESSPDVSWRALAGTMTLLSALPLCGLLLALINSMGLAPIMAAAVINACAALEMVAVSLWYALRSRPLMERNLNRRSGGE